MLERGFSSTEGDRHPETSLKTEAPQYFQGSSEPVLLLRYFSLLPNLILIITECFFMNIPSIAPLKLSSLVNMITLNKNIHVCALASYGNIYQAFSWHFYYSFNPQSNTTKWILLVSWLSTGQGICTRPTALSCLCPVSWMTLHFSFHITDL